MEFLTGPLQLPFVQRGLLEVALLSVGAGLLGTWIVLRGLAFYSHAAGAAAFPGLVLADGLGFAPTLGAFGAAVLFAGIVGRLARVGRSDYDSVTGLTLTGALALGVILASDVFNSGANLETLLFGSLLVLEPHDLVLAGVASGLVAAATLTVGRVWLARGFDREGTDALRVRTEAPEAVLLGLIALLVVASLSAIGALLATTMLVVPAATVRLYARRLPAWQLGAVALTAVESSAGLWLSVKLNAPPGATIAMLAGATFAVVAATRSLVWRRLRMPVVAAVLMVLAVFGLSACGDSSSTSSGKLQTVATTTQIGDWVHELGGEEVDVHQILAANSDPHDYEPRPRDVEAVAGAKVVFTSGDGLDDWVEGLVDQAGGDPEVVDLGASVPARHAGVADGAGGSVDPHWWHDPRNVIAATRVIRVALVRAAPVDSATFQRNARRYAARLRRLDSAIAACIDRVPRSDRKLVTDHDAFGYFAGRYGIDVVGAAIPARSTQAQASAGDVAALVRLIEREGVRAVFPESSVNPELARAIARETGASADLTLYGDTLGPPGSTGDTYVKMEAANAEAMARGFSGGDARCPVTAK